MYLLRMLAGAALVGLVASLVPMTSGEMAGFGTTDGLVLRAVARAQQLATAYVDGDWNAARLINPVPAYSDAEYEQGYAGLEASKLFLADSEINGTVVDMWLTMVAHEIREAGHQTSLYCVHWAYDDSSATIAGIRGDLVLTQPEFAEPDSLQGRGQVECPRFDVGGESPPAEQEDDSPTDVVESPIRPGSNVAGEFEVDLDERPSVVGMMVITVGVDRPAVQRGRSSRTRLHVRRLLPERG